MRCVALDIETLGLLETSPLPEITCACLYDGTREYCLQFIAMPSDIRDQNIGQLLALLDSAETLVGYNAILFDLEFIKRAFGITPQRMSAWVRKTIDPYMYLKACLCTTSSLSNLLLINNLPCKTGSGKEAISMALEGKYEQLLQYCLMDAKLVFRLCHLPLIKLGHVSDTSVMSIDFSSGKWVLAHVEADGKKRSSMRTSKSNVVFPIVGGVPLKAVLMPQILSPVHLINPEALEWINVFMEI